MFNIHWLGGIRPLCIFKKWNSYIQLQEEKGLALLDFSNNEMLFNTKTKSGKIKTFPINDFL